MPLWNDRCADFTWDFIVVLSDEEVERTDWRCASCPASHRDSLSLCYLFISAHCNIDELPCPSVL